MVVKIGELGPIIKSVWYCYVCVELYYYCIYLTLLFISSFYEHVMLLTGMAFAWYLFFKEDVRSKYLPEGIFRVVAVLKYIFGMFFLPQMTRYKYVIISWYVSQMNSR